MALAGHLGEGVVCVPGLVSMWCQAERRGYFPAIAMGKGWAQVGVPLKSVLHHPSPPPQFSCHGQVEWRELRQEKGWHVPIP